MGISKKLLTDDLAFSRSSGKVHLKYKGKQLAVIAETVLYQLLLDAAPASFLKDLAKVAGVESSVPAYSEAVIKLATVYSYERLVGLGKSPTGLSDEKVLALTHKLLSDKKTVADFKKALLIMRDAEIKDCQVFIKAQVEGLQFVNGGKGTFPKPSQLTTANALNRVFDFTAKTTMIDVVDDQQKIEKPKGYWYFNHHTDGQLGLNKNQKYKEVLSKIDSATATLEECVYAQKCFSARRDGKPYAKIEDYIKKISK